MDVGYTPMLLELALRHSIEKWPTIIRSDWRAFSEAELLENLIRCLLSSGVKYELSLAYIKMFDAADMWSRAIRGSVTIDDIREILYRPALCNGRMIRYRFPASKSRQIFNTINNIYVQDRTLLSIISSGANAYETRDTLVRLCPGIGLKQASMFLRDIGYHLDFAIIDSHILNYMKILSLVPSDTKSLKSKDYRLIERSFVEYARQFNSDIATIDTVVWYLMRTFKSKQSWE